MSEAPALCVTPRNSEVVGKRTGVTVARRDLRGIYLLAPVRSGARGYRRYSGCGTTQAPAPEPGAGEAHSNSDKARDKGEVGRDSGIGRWVSPVRTVAHAWGCCVISGSTAVWPALAQ
jgi:hypothetical protein